MRSSRDGTPRYHLVVLDSEGGLRAWGYGRPTLILPMAVEAAGRDDRRVAVWPAEPKTLLEDSGTAAAYARILLGLEERS